MGAFYIRGQKDCRDQQDNDSRIYQICKYIIKLALQHQYHKDQPERQPHPDQLGAGAARRIEQPHVVKLITGATDAEPTGHDQNHIQQDRPPVYCLPYFSLPPIIHDSVKIKRLVILLHSTSSLPAVYFLLISHPSDTSPSSACRSAHRK